MVASKIPGVSALFTPITINGVTLPNRFAVPPMQRGWAEKGVPLIMMGEQYRRYIEGGSSLVISESCAVNHPTATNHDSACWLRPDTTEAWANIVREVKKADGKIFM